MNIMNVLYIKSYPTYRCNVIDYEGSSNYLVPNFLFTFSTNFQF